MSIDLGLVSLTPQTGHCARAASQALLKELLGKGLARRGVSGCVASAGPAWVGRKGPTPFWGLTCLRALQRPLGAATISEIYFGICSSVCHVRQVVESIDDADCFHPPTIQDLR